MALKSSVCGASGFVTGNFLADHETAMAVASKTDPGIAVGMAAPGRRGRGFVTSEVKAPARDALLFFPGLHLHPLRFRRCLGGHWLTTRKSPLAPRRQRPCRHKVNESNPA